MPALVRLMFWFVAICCFDDGPTPEFRADLISSGQSIPCKLEDIRVGKAIVLEVRIANKLEEPIEIDRVEPSCGCTARDQWFEEYVGETGRVEYEQVQAAPNGPNKKLYSDDTKVCYVIYDCETECVRLKGSLTCVRKDKPRVTVDFHEFKINGDCPAQPPNPNPEPPKPEVVPDLD